MAHVLENRFVLVKDFPQYRVTRGGRIWSVKRRRFLKPWLRGDYFLVKLCKSGQEFTRSVHLIVIENFICARPPGHECLHISGNSFNNRVSNLRWGTIKENTADRFKHGAFGKLSKAQVLRIRALRGYSQSSIAKRFRVSQSTVSRILAEKIWTQQQRELK